MPRRGIVLDDGDIVILGAEPTSDGEEIDLKEIVLSEHSDWVGRRIRDLDISRKSLVVMVKRGGEVIIPRGDHEFRAGDRVFMYTESRVPNAAHIKV